MDLSFDGGTLVVQDGMLTLRKRILFRATVVERPLSDFRTVSLDFQKRGRHGVFYTVTLVGPVVSLVVWERGARLKGSYVRAFRLWQDVTALAGLPGTGPISSGWPESLIGRRSDETGLPLQDLLRRGRLTLEPAPGPAPADLSVRDLRDGGVEIKAQADVGVHLTVAAFMCGLLPLLMLFDDGYSVHGFAGFAAFYIIMLAVGAVWASCLWLLRTTILTVDSTGTTCRASGIGRLPGQPRRHTFRSDAIRYCYADGTHVIVADDQACHRISLKGESSRRWLAVAIMRAACLGDAGVSSLRSSAAGSAAPSHAPSDGGRHDIGPSSGIFLK